MNTYFAVFLLMGISIMSLLAGFNPTLFSSFDKYCPNINTCGGGAIFSGVVNSVITYIFSWNGALTTIAAVATIAVIGGLNLLVVVPFALMFVLVDMLIIPTDIILSLGLPSPLPIILVVAFKMLMLMVIISFIRTGN